jgi:hypothetical protein
VSCPGSHKSSDSQGIVLIHKEEIHYGYAVEHTT